MTGSYRGFGALLLIIQYLLKGLFFLSEVKSTQAGICAASLDICLIYIPKEFKLL
jgi:hypothetical protein